jgi:hypothetical protein
MFTSSLPCTPPTCCLSTIGRFSCEARRLSIQLCVAPVSTKARIPVMPGVGGFPPFSLNEASKPISTSNVGPYTTKSADPVAPPGISSNPQCASGITGAKHDRGRQACRRRPNLANEIRPATKTLHSFGGCTLRGVKSADKLPFVDQGPFPDAALQLRRQLFIGGNIGVKTVLRFSFHITNIWTRSGWLQFNACPLLTSA